MLGIGLEVLEPLMQQIITMQGIGLEVLEPLMQQINNHAGHWTRGT